MVENGGNVSKAMREAGYKSTTATTPKKLTTSKAFKKLGDYFDDEFLQEQHKKLFVQKRVDYFVFPKKMSDEEIVEHVAASGITVITVRESDRGKMAFYSLPDAIAIKGGLEMAHKIKGSYAAEKTEVKVETKVDENILELATQAAELLKAKKIQNADSN